MNRSLWHTFLFAGGSAALAVLIVIYPRVAIDASLAGLQIWWEHVFPALFPFFVLSELMIGFGVVTFFGMLFEPIMRPIFKVPGNGAFVMVMGMISGFPAGARITARLYEEKRLTKTEAERLSSFTSFSNPLFIFGVTAIGFFGEPSLGIVLALAHYSGNICVGLTMRLYKSGQSIGRRRTRERLRPFSFFSEALRNMHRERIRRWKPLGKMLGDAVTVSVTTLLSIGGFIALFSMLAALLNEIHLTDSVGHLLGLLLGKAGFSTVLGYALIPGLFELTIGANEIGSSDAPLIERTVLVSLLLGFSGFSIQAQAVSILVQAGLSAKPFLIGRLFHAFYASAASIFFYRLLDPVEKTNLLSSDVTVYLHIPDLVVAHKTAGSLITLAGLLLFILILLFRAREKNQANR